MAGPSLSPKSFASARDSAICVAPVWANVTARPTTISGYGITDAVALSPSIVASVFRPLRSKASLIRLSRNTS